MDNKTLEHVITQEDITNFPHIFSFANPSEMVGETVMISPEQDDIIKDGVTQGEATLNALAGATDVKPSQDAGVAGAPALKKYKVLNESGISIMGSDGVVEEIVHQKDEIVSMNPDSEQTGRFLANGIIEEVTEPAA